MNRIVFFADGMIMEVQQSNNYLKRQIKTRRKFDGAIPYRFSRPYSLGEIKGYYEGRGRA